jgi:hypothetical protein
MRAFVLLSVVVTALSFGVGRAAQTWYVSAGAAAGGDGSFGAPFDSLADVEATSAAGDTIIVLASGAPLDGGIALKPDQRLIGDGPSVVGSTASELPRITNTSATHLDGDGVRLAAGAEVANVVVAGTVRGAIYGLDVTGVNVHGNDVSGHNTSCTIGFEVLPLVAPTNGPFIGVPFGADVPGYGYVYVIYIPNGWAGIMVDASYAVGHVRIADNLVHDATCGDGIDMRLRGTADLTAVIEGNTVTHLAQGHFEGTQPAVSVDSIMAIGLQTDDSARLVVDEIGNTQTYIGGPDSDCEGLFFDVSGSSTMIARVDGNTFAHGIGGTSCNGMELITGLDNATADVRVANSLFEDNPGDMIEAGNLGKGSKMYLELDNVTVRNTTIRGGNGGPIPFNIGECLLAGNSGTDEVFTLRIRNSEFTECNNGVVAASNVAIGNGAGVAAESLVVDIADSKIHGNAYYNLWVQNATPLRTLSVKVSGTDLRNAGETGVAIDARPTGLTLSSAIDLGGGVLGSPGGNCIFSNGTLDAETTLYHVVARSNWWGSAAGPAAGKTSASPSVLSGLDTGSPLGAAPAACS